MLGKGPLKKGIRGEGPQKWISEREGGSQRMGKKNPNTIINNFGKLDKLGGGVWQSGYFFYNINSLFEACFVCFSSYKLGFSLYLAMTRKKKDVNKKNLNK